MAYDWTPHLDPDERILWEGRPDPRIFMLRRLDVLLIPICIIWTVGVLTLLVWFVVKGAPAPLLAIILAFSVYGVYITIGRFLHDAYLRRRAVYALTNKRALIAQGGLCGCVRRFTLDTKTRVALRRRPLPGSVEIGLRFTRYPPLFAWFAYWLGGETGFTFRGLTDPQPVYDLIRLIQSGDA